MMTHACHPVISSRTLSLGPFRRGPSLVTQLYLVDYLDQADTYQALPLIQMNQGSNKQSSLDTSITAHVPNQLAGLPFYITGYVTNQLVDLPFI